MEFNSGFKGLIGCKNAGIGTHDLSRRTATDLRLRPRGHWDRHMNWIIWIKL